MNPLVLPVEKIRCLAHGLERGDRRPAYWCERRDECARHVAIRFDPFNGSVKVDPRLCKAGGKDHFIPLIELDYT